MFGQWHGTFFGQWFGDEGSPEPPIEPPIPPSPAFDAGGGRARPRIDVSALRRRQLLAEDEMILSIIVAWLTVRRLS